MLSVSDSPDGTTVTITFDVQTNHGLDYLNHPSQHTDDLQYDCDGKPITEPSVSEGIRRTLFVILSLKLIISIFSHRLQFSSSICAVC